MGHYLSMYNIVDFLYISGISHERCLHGHDRLILDHMFIYQFRYIHHKLQNESHITYVRYNSNCGDLCGERMGGAELHTYK